MGDLTINHFLAVSAILFTIGVVGIFVNRKNIIVILMAIELILLSVNINLVAFSVYTGTIHDSGSDICHAGTDRCRRRSGDRPGHSRRVFPQSRRYCGRER